MVSFLDSVTKRLPFSPRTPPRSSQTSPMPFEPATPKTKQKSPWQLPVSPWEPIKLVLRIFPRWLLPWLASVSTRILLNRMGSTCLSQWSCFYVWILQSTWYIYLCWQLGNSHGVGLHRCFQKKAVLPQLSRPAVLNFLVFLSKTVSAAEMLHFELSDTASFTSLAAWSDAVKHLCRHDAASSVSTGSVSFGSGSSEKLPDLKLQIFTGASYVDTDDKWSKSIVSSFEQKNCIKFLEDELYCVTIMWVGVVLLLLLYGNLSLIVTFSAILPRRPWMSAIAQRSGRQSHLHLLVALILISLCPSCVSVGLSFLTTNAII